MFSKQTILKALVLVGVAASAPLVAKADTLEFDLTGPGLGSGIIFSLPSSPTPSTSVSDEYFILNTVMEDVNGTDETDQLVFFTSTDGGGIDDFDAYFNLSGSQLFTGDVSDPTFTTGDFELSPAYDAGADNYSLDITDVSAVAPEPGSLLLLGTGLLGVCGVLRRKLVA